MGTTAFPSARTALPLPLICAFVIGVIVCLATSAADAQPADDTVRLEARRIVSAGQHPWLGQSRFGDHRATMEALYMPGANIPLWLSTPRARNTVPALIQVLGAAAEKGLDPRDYDSDALGARHAMLARGSAAAADVAALDVGLSLAFIRFLSDVHLGRVDPRKLHFGIDVTPKRVDLARLARDAAATGRIREAVTAAEPALPMYGRMLDALARFRALAAGPALDPLPSIRSGKLEPGDEYPALSTLARRLNAFGDLAADWKITGDLRYDGEIVDAVRRFQGRHGLDTDGIVGHATRAALNVPVAARVRQIELALERLRWLPDLPRTRAIAINIPEFKLWAFDPAHFGAQPAFRMNVVVGHEAPTHRTPIFAERMTYLEFSPYWNVPRGILHREVLPRLRKDPGYLERENMELVDASGKVSTRIDGVWLDALARGDARMRQRPGPRNAVGGVKFVFPNHANVYLHDTPARELFAWTRRDFSHGCIRVEDPVKLARFVLAAQPDWTEERILTAMTSGETQFVRLAEAVPVLIFYITAIVDPDGRLLFLPDPYGHDAALRRALAGRRAA